MNLVRSIKQLVALASSSLFVSLPYLVAYSRYTNDTMVTRDVRRHFAIARPQRVVLLTDTFFEVNGVSAPIRRMLEAAIRRNIDFTVVTCVSAEEREARCAEPEIKRLLDLGRLKLFTAVVSMNFSEYAELNLHMPPFLDLLRYLTESG